MPGRNWNRKKVFCLLSLTLFLLWTTSGCAVVHVHDKTGKTEVTRGIGVITIDAPQGADGYVLSLDGIGAFAVDGSFSLGYVDLRMAAIEPSCHVLFWIENEAQANNIKVLLDDMDGVCFLQKTPDTNEQGETK